MYIFRHPDQKIVIPQGTKLEDLPFYIFGSLEQHARGHIDSFWAENPNLFTNLDNNPSDKLVEVGIYEICILNFSSPFYFNIEVYED